METLYLRFISNEKAVPSASRITALIYRDNLYVFLVTGVRTLASGGSMFLARSGFRWHPTHNDTLAYQQSRGRIIRSPDQRGQRYCADHHRIVVTVSVNLRKSENHQLVR